MKHLLPMLVGWAIFGAVVLIGCVLTVGLASCDDPSDPTTHHTEIKREANYVHYYKDGRTNLCFAGQPNNYYASTITYVPCTPEVEKLAEPFPEYVGP